MQYTAKTDTITISNTGCDTLKITNIPHSLTAYSLSSTLLHIPPSSSQNIIVTFNPHTAGHLYDTLHIMNNDSNITVCLHGYAYSPPELSVIPDSINITTSMCNDSINVPIIISNTGDTYLIWNLNLYNDTTMLRFDGSNDEVSMGTWFNYQTFTIELWVKAGTWQNQYADIFDNNHTDYRSFVMQQNYTTLNQYSWGMCDGGNNGSLFNLTAGQWTHIAVTRDQATKVRKLYINGSLYASITGTHDITYDGTQFFRLGRWGGGGRYWNGDMDEVRIWSTVRSQQDISNNMHKHITGNESGLVGYWNFNEGTGSLANDKSGNGHNSTVSGATWAVSDAPIASLLLEVDTLSGVIPSGTSDTVNISFNSNGLPGTFLSYIIINSNDPLHTSDSVPYTIIINDKPSAPITSDVIICNGEPVPDLTAIGNNIIWYNDTGIVHVGNIFSTGETAIGTYQYYVTQTIDSCEGYRDTVTLNIYAIPSAPHTTNMVVCYNDSVPNLSATGTNVIWYSDPALSNPVYYGNTYPTGITATGSYIYYVTQTVNNCTSPSDTVTLTINPNPLPPTTSDTTICFGESTPDLIVHGDSIRWYSDSLLTNLIHTGDTLMPGVSSHGIYHYYVTQTNTEYNCQGHASMVTLTIDSLPNKPVTANQTVCFGEPTPNMTATGDSIRWYTDAALTQLIHTGNTYNSGETNTGIYIYYVTQNNQCGESSYGTDTLTIYAIPLAPVGVDQSVCFGTPAPSLNCAGAGITWYSDPAMTVIAGTGNNYPTGMTAVGIYDYFVTQTINGCEGPADTVTLEIRQIPATPTSADTAICFGTPTPELSAIGNSLEWYSDVALTTLVNTGNYFTPTETAVGEYTYYIIEVDAIVNCTSFTDSVKLTINPIPSAPFASDETICFDQTTPDLSVTGSNIIWYDDPALTSIVNTGNNYSTGLTAVGAYSFYTTQTVNNCTSPSDTVTLTINPNPLPPTTSDTTICFGESTPDLIVHGDSIRWYSDSLLTNLIYTGDTLVSGVSSHGIYHYYVTQTNSGYNCQGHPSVVTLTIDSLLPAPVTVDQSICYGQPTPDIVAIGDSIRWYTDVALTQFVFSGNTFSTGETAVGVYVYYLTQNNHCGESTADSVTLTIKSVPPAPVSTDEAVCFGDTVPDLIASGTNIIWYSDSLLTTVVGTDTVLATGMTAAGVYEYFVTQSANGCESPLTEVTLTINPIPLQPVAADQAVCVNNPIPDLIATGTNIVWYDSTYTTPIHYGNTLVTGQTAAGNYVYYVTQTDPVSLCTSLPDTVFLEIDVPLSAPVANDLIMCEDAGPAILTATGVNITWYDDAILTHLVYSGNTFNTGITLPGVYNYFVIQTNECGNSISDTVILIINHLPATPNTNDVSVCYGNPITPLTATGNNINWYSDSTLTTLLFSGNNFTPPVTLPGIYIYYASSLDTVTGCYSLPAKATLTIKALPLPPVTSDTSTCFGSDVPELIALGTNIQWYSDPQLLNYIDSGNTLNTGQTSAGTYIYYVTQTNDCGQSLASTATLYIYTNPPTPITSNASICYGDPAPTLSVTGTNVIWYSNASLTTIIEMGNNYVPSDTDVGIYTYYVTQTDLVTGCVSVPGSVVFTIYNSSVPPVVSNASCCIGDPVPSLYATGTNITWYSNQTLTNPVQWGNSYTPPVSGIGTYTYYVTQETAYCGISPAATATLTINPIPSPPITNNVTACSNEFIPDLTASGNNINWYSESNLILLVHTGNTYNTGHTDAGTYTYFVTQTVDGCTSIASKVILYIHPSPLITLNHYNVTISEGESVTLIAYNALNYTWTPSEGLNTTTAPAVIASPDTTTRYWVTGTSANGCSDTASCLVEVGTNILNNTITSYLSVYPNPTDGKLFIKYESTRQEKIKISLVDMLSKSLMIRNTETVNGVVEFTLDMGMFDNGIYNLQVETETHVYNQKIVLKHKIY